MQSDTESCTVTEVVVATPWDEGTPEIVTVGIGPDDAPAGGDCIVGRFPFQASGRLVK